jgi:hypothetical protein
MSFVSLRTRSWCVLVNNSPVAGSCFFSITCFPSFGTPSSASVEAVGYIPRERWRDSTSTVIFWSKQLQLGAASSASVEAVVCVSERNGEKPSAVSSFFHFGAPGSVSVEAVLIAVLIA